MVDKNQPDLIDRNALKSCFCKCCNLVNHDEPCEPSDCEVMALLDEPPSVDAVEAKKYEALVEMYHGLREDFIDFYCSGIPNVAPYCLNRCEECVDTRGWCKHTSDKCRGFNPAEVVLDKERKNNEREL